MLPGGQNPFHLELPEPEVGIKLYKQRDSGGSGGGDGGGKNYSSTIGHVVGGRKTVILLEDEAKTEPRQRVPRPVE